MEGTESAQNGDDGRHAFDFFFGSWEQSNRKRVRPLVDGDDEWVEFESHTEAGPILGGLGNIDTFAAPDFPGRPGFEGFSLRLFEPETGLWRIWWASAKSGGRLDEPVVGRFDGPVGTFECDDTFEGRPIRVRYRWSDVDTEHPRWEQAFSPDGGQTWEVNWMAVFTRRTAG